jgi:hypothetical protein
MDGDNPFCFRVYIGSPNELPPTSLFLDPRDTHQGASKESVISELNRFYDLVKAKMSASSGNALNDRIIYVK